MDTIYQLSTFATVLFFIFLGIQVEYFSFFELRGLSNTQVGLIAFMLKLISQNCWWKNKQIASHKYEPKCKHHCWSNIDLMSFSIYSSWLAMEAHILIWFAINSFYFCDLNTNKMNACVRNWLHKLYHCTVCSPGYKIKFTGVLSGVCMRHPIPQCGRKGRCDPF